MSPLLQEILKQVEQLSPEDRQELIRQINVSTRTQTSQVDSSLGTKLREIRAQIVEAGIPLLSDAELEEEIASRRGEQELTHS
jgi:hypothetical protein